MYGIPGHAPRKTLASERDDETKTHKPRIAAGGFTTRARVRARRRALLLLGAALPLVGFATLGGCYRRVVERDGFYSELQQRMERRRAAQRQGGGIQVPSGSWAIRLEAHEDRAEARRRLETLREATDIPDLWMRRAGDETVLYRGRYRRPEGRPAQQDLRQTRMLQVHGDRPFQDASVVNLEESGPSPAGPLDLRQQQGAYTLQVAYFDGDYGGDRKKAALEAAKRLREDGHEAYYYHGPNYSMVTVGLFARNAFVRKNKQWQYGEPIKKLREAFPYNQHNRMPESWDEPPEEGEAPQESMVVRVP